MHQKHPLLTVFLFLLFFSVGSFTLSVFSSSSAKGNLAMGKAVKGISTSISPKVKPTATPTPSPTPTLTPTPTSSPNIVKYTDNGFSPKTLTISKGESVTFENESETDMWVASNYFPTSRLYPGTDNAKCDTAKPGTMFDECVGVVNGKSWNFTFNSIGRWTYHNHLKPNDGGTIVVTAD